MKKKVFKVGQLIKGSNGKHYVVVLQKDRSDNRVCDRCCFYQKNYGCTLEYYKTFSVHLDCSRLTPENSAFIEVEEGI
jgi:hypothetical protein